MRKILIIALITILSVPRAMAETEETGNLPNLYVVNTMDATDLNLAQPLQMALGQLYQSTGAVNVQLADYSFSSVTAQASIYAFEQSEADLLSFVQINKNSVTVFLFARDRREEYVASAKRLDDAPDGTLTSPFIESRFVEAVTEVLAKYSAGQFQPLPGGSNLNLVGLDRSTSEQANEARLLYRELASLSKDTWYMGANIGMARYSQEDTSRVRTAISAVAFGTYGGYRINDRSAIEAGLDVYTHLLFHGDYRYHVPFAEKYINLSVTGGLGKPLARITQNTSSSSTPLTATTGILAGPGIGFDVPLLGCVLRGEVRYYIGATSTMLASYGIVIPF